MNDYTDFEALCMKNIELADSCKIPKYFVLTGTPVGLAPYGNGHINDTFLLTCEGENETIIRYILQSVNENVFKEPELVINNISLVSDFLRSNSADSREVLTMIPTFDGKYCVKDEKGRCWRIYEFVENSVCLELPESTDDFYQCAYAFGKFQNKLNDFDASLLCETIKDFHNTPLRYRIFLDAVKADPLGRAKTVADEIKFAMDRAEFYSTLYDAHNDGRLPLRVTHNDTKINNVLLDKETRKALCVIDLDTIMPGFSVNDFGDSIRSGAGTAAEDEKDASKMHLDINMYEAYVKGFIDGTEGLLAKEELLLFPEGAKMMTMECGMRFLSDYLLGDTYFKIKYPEHNLVRCRTQFALVADMEKHWDEMHEIVKKYL